MDNYLSQNIESTETTSGAATPRPKISKYSTNPNGIQSIGDQLQQLPQSTTPASSDYSSVKKIKVTTTRYRIEKNA